MSIKRIFIVISAIFAVSAVFADNSSVTSKKYVDDLMSGYQGKLPGSGANTLMIYDDSEDGIGEKSIAATLGNSASAVSVPTVGAVKGGLDGKQDTITGTAGYVMTGTDTPGEVGEKPIYSANTNYSDSLVTAETVNTGVINAVNSSLIRVNENGAADSNGTLWKISDDLWAINANVPYGYTELQYVDMNSGSYLLTDIVPQGDYRIEFDFATTSFPPSNTSLFGERPTNSVGSGIQLGLGTSGQFTFDGLRARYNPTTLAMINTRYKYVWNNKNVTLTSGSTTIGSYTFTGEETQTHPLIFNGLNNAGTSSAGKAGIYLYSFKVWNPTGQLIANYVPATYNNTVGFYDTVSKTFKTATSGTFTAGPSCISPNLFDKNNLPERINAYFTSTGTTWSYTEAGYSLRFPCLPNTTYTARYNGNSTQAVLSFASTNNDTIPTPENGTIAVTQAIRQNSPTINTPITLTTGANDKWLIVQYNAVAPQNTDMADNLQIELGSTATTYRPYGQNICD